MPSDESKGSQLDAIGSLAQRQLDNTSGNDATRSIASSREEIWQVIERATRFLPSTHAVDRGRQPREHRHVGWMREGGRADRRLEDGRPARELVETRRRVALIAVGTEVIGAKTVERNENEIRSRGREGFAAHDHRIGPIGEYGQRLTAIAGSRPGLESQSNPRAAPTRKIDFPVEPLIGLTPQHRAFENSGLARFVAQEHPKVDVGRLDLGSECRNGVRKTHDGFRGQVHVEAEA